MKGLAMVSDPIPAIEIEHGVPVPPSASGAVRGPYWALAEAMAIGDSVVLSPAAANSLVNIFRKSGFAAAVRSLDDGRKRVWKQQKRETGNGRDDKEKSRRAAQKRHRDKTEDERATRELED
jgi:hypothetical protein